MVIRKLRRKLYVCIMYFLIYIIKFYFILILYILIFQDPDIVGEKSEPKNISPLLDPESKQIVKHIGCGNKFCVITTCNSY